MASVHLKFILNALSTGNRRQKVGRASLVATRNFLRPGGGPKELATNSVLPSSRVRRLSQKRVRLDFETHSRASLFDVGQAESSTRRPLAALSAKAAAICVLVVAGALIASPAMARPGELETPYDLSLHYSVHASTTVGRGEAIDVYSCANTTPEEGPETVYAFALPAASKVTATVSGDGDGVDVDVHVLDSLTVAAGMATGCVARGNTTASADVDADVVYVVVDTYLNNEKAGPYILTVDIVPKNAWRRRRVADGVVLRTLVYEDGDDRQMLSTLEVDLDADDVSVRPLVGAGCEPTSQLGSDNGAIAAVNGGFFDDLSCASTSLVKIDDELLTTNEAARTTIGFSGSDDVAFALLGPEEDFPDMTHALGGWPRLIEDGVDVVEPGLEAVSASMSDVRRPRTAVAAIDDNRLLLATVDGQTDAADGMTLQELSDFLLESDAVDGLNLQGGGATTMWVEAFDIGVINHPADNGRPDHEGERAVVSALGVFAPSVEGRPIFLTSLSDVTAGEGEATLWQVEAGPPVHADVSYQVDSAGAGQLDWSVDDDGVLNVSYVGIWPDGADGPIAVDVIATANGESETATLHVEVVPVDTDEDGMPDGWEAAVGLEVGIDDGADDADGDGKTNREEFEAGTDPLSAVGVDDAGSADDADSGEPFDDEIDVGDDEADAAVNDDDDEISAQPGCSSTNVGGHRPHVTQAALLILFVATCRRRRDGR